MRGQKREKCKREVMYWLDFCNGNYEEDLRKKHYKIHFHDWVTKTAWGRNGGIKQRSYSESSEIDVESLWQVQPDIKN